ncbi:helix-turn-helix transcriptional regulator [Nitratireductor basaltis]|uniref:Transcriptional regulator, LuxR family n=1 Tax=Nitratireductor basaltis TaxID=472175 RepID=A0A084UB18_9HYPH|nr:LuxR family transcriptional regulator [Nitratireductor basaltis]KFB10154.1 Transcriptional regulator, LuxR family [Nitratireductor basaltis]
MPIVSAGGQDAQTALESLTASPAILHASYQLNPINPLPLAAPLTRTTFPPEWITRYVIRDFLMLDPVVAYGFSSPTPFYWHEMELEPRQLEFMADAVAHGIGQDGFVIPVMEFGRRGMLAVTTNLPRKEWIAAVDELRDELGEMAHRIHRLLCQSDDAGDASPRVLAKRERECLAWVANGLDAEAIARKLALSSYTVRGYLRAAREKLGCRTLSQAVARAIQMKQIDP